MMRNNVQFFVFAHANCYSHSKFMLQTVPFIISPDAVIYMYNVLTRANMNRVPLFQAIVTLS